MPLNNPSTYLGPVSQTQPTRVAGTVYQNLTGKAIYLTIVLTMNGNVNNQAAFLSDTTATPSTTIAALNFPLLTDSIATGFILTVSAIVIPGNYYELTVSGATLINWTEWN